MAANVISKLIATLSLDDSKFKQGMSNAQKKTNGLSKSMASLGPVIAAAFSVRAISNFIVESVKAYDTQIKAETKLLTALKGRRDVQEFLISQAQRLQGITLFGDEETIQAQAMLASLGLNADAITKLTPLVQDLATKANMSLVTSADLIAKSVGSSTNALSRYGIVITGTVGTTERLNSAVESLNKQVGGQAAAAALSGLGPLQQLGNAFGDLTEQIGKSIIEGEKFNKSITSLLWLVDQVSIGIAILTGDVGLLARKATESLNIKPIQDLGEAYFYLNKYAEDYSTALKEGDTDAQHRLTIRIDSIRKIIKLMKEAELLAGGEKTITTKDTSLPTPDTSKKAGLIEQIEARIELLRLERRSITNVERIFEINRDIVQKQEILNGLKAVEPASPDISSLYPSSEGNESGSLNALREEINLLQVLQAQVEIGGAAWRSYQVQLDQVTDSMNTAVDIIPELSDIMVDLGQITEDVLSAAFTGLANSMVDIFEGKNIIDAFKDFISDMGRLMATYGALLIAQGIAQKAFENGEAYTKIIAGAAMLALGLAVAAGGASINSSGGSGSTSTGSRTATYGGGIGYDYNREIIMVARGEDLVAVINRQNYKSSING